MQEDHYIPESRNRSSLTPEQQRVRVSGLPATSPASTSAASASPNSTRRRRRGSGEILQDAANSVIRTVTGSRFSKSPAEKSNRFSEEARGTHALAKTNPGSGGWLSVFGARRSSSSNNNNNAARRGRLSWKRASTTRYAKEVDHEMSEALWAGRGAASSASMELWRQHLTPVLLSGIMGLVTPRSEAASPVSALQALSLMCAKGSVDPLLVDYLHALLQSSDSDEVLAIALGVTRSLSDSELCQLALREVESGRRGGSTFERCLKRTSAPGVRFAACAVLTESHLPRLEALQARLGGSVVGCFESEQDREDAGEDLRDWIVKTWQLVAELIVPTDVMEPTEEGELLAERALRGLQGLFRLSLAEQSEREEVESGVSATKTAARTRVSTYLSSRLPRLMRFGAGHASTTLALASLLAYDLRARLTTPSLQANSVARYARALLEIVMQEHCDPAGASDLSDVADAVEAALLLASLEACESLRAEACAAASDALLRVLDLASAGDNHLVDRCMELILVTSRQTQALAPEKRLHLLARVANVALAAKPMRAYLETVRGACRELVRSAPEETQLEDWLGSVAVWSDAASASRHVSRHVLAYYLLLASVEQGCAPSEQARLLEALTDCLRFADIRQRLDGTSDLWMEAAFDAYVERVNVLAPIEPRVRDFVMQLLATTSSKSASRPSSPSRRSTSEGASSPKRYLHPKTRARLCQSLAETATLEGEILSEDDSIALVSYMTKIISAPAAFAVTPDVLAVYAGAAAALGRKHPRRLIDAVSFALRSGMDASPKDSLEYRALSRALHDLVGQPIKIPDASEDHDEKSAPSSTRVVARNERRVARTGAPAVRAETKRLSGPGDALFVAARVVFEKGRLHVAVRVVNVSQTITLQDVKFQVGVGANALLSTPPKDAAATAAKLLPEGTLVFAFDVDAATGPRISDFDERTLFVSWSAKSADEPLRIDLPAWTLNPLLCVRPIPELEPYSRIHPQDFRLFWERMRYVKRCKATLGGPAETAGRPAVALGFPHTARLDAGTSSNFHVTGYACRSPTNDGSALLFTCIRTSETSVALELRSNDREQLTLGNVEAWCRAALGEKDSRLILVDYVTSKEWPGGEDDDARFMDHWQLRRLEGWALPKYNQPREEEGRQAGPADHVDAAETRALLLDAAMAQWQGLRDASPPRAPA